MRTKLRSIRFISGVGLVTLLAACGGTTARAATQAKPLDARMCTPRSVRAVAPEAATVTAPVTAFRSPGGAHIERFARLNVNGAPMVFGVLGERVDVHCRATWLHVELPIRPNGATGWVRADHVDRVPVHTRIVVDLSERSVSFYRRDKLVLRSVAAVGSTATPTPVGRYYVNQLLVPSDTSGAFGPGAIGISAFSPVLTGWAQGGPVAIHGTNEPWSIGRAVSNGCIRLHNPVLKKLFAQTPAGTPVIIKT